MSDSAQSVTVAVTPMHAKEDGVWEAGPRQGAEFYIVEIVRRGGEDAEIVVECRDERSAAFAARVAGATAVALGLASPAGSEDVEAFDEDTARILGDNPTPEIAVPTGEWRQEEGPDAS